MTSEAQNVLQQIESGWLQPPTLKPNLDRTFNICGVSYLNKNCCNFTSVEIELAKTSSGNELVIAVAKQVML